eukprot:Gb_00979 [translate_table: standard]
MEAILRRFCLLDPSWKHCLKVCSKVFKYWRAFLIRIDIYNLQSSSQVTFTLVEIDVALNRCNYPNVGLNNHLIDTVASRAKSGFGFITSPNQGNKERAQGIQRCKVPAYDRQLYERLRTTVESPAFLAKLHTFHENGKIATEDPAIIKVEGDTLVNTNPEDPSWWLWVTDDMVPGKVEERCGLDNEGYIFVTEEDIVDGIATFLARYIVSNPQTEKMTPEQLQKTLSTAFASMNSRNTIKKLWDAGKFMYTAVTWGIAIAGFYRHPFILKAAMKAILASGRILVRAL